MSEDEKETQEHSPIIISSFEKNSHDMQGTHAIPIPERKPHTLRSKMQKTLRSIMLGVGLSVVGGMTVAQQETTDALRKIDPGIIPDKPKVEREKYEDATQTIVSDKEER